MKRLLAVLVCLLMTAAPWVEAQDLFYSFNAPTGLVGRWKLCGDTSATSGCAASSSTTVYDSSGYGNNGTWNGTASGTTGYYSAGKVGPYAGHFDGSTNRISLGVINETSAITLTAWAYATALNNQNFILGKGEHAQGTCASPYAAYSINFGTVMTLNFDFDLSTGGVRVQTHTTTAPVINTWYFIAATYDGSNSRLYVNGVQVASNPQTGSIDTNSYNTYIGDQGGCTSLFTGLINDARIYNRALSAGEIAQMYLAHN